MAGLGCAQQLSAHKKDFAIITEDIGGRLCTSPDGKINYGAYFVLDNYRHVLSFVKKGEKLHPFSLEFHLNKKGYGILNMLKYPWQTLRFFIFMYKFKHHYEKFKKRCEVMSQKEALEKDMFMFRLYCQTAAVFIKEKNIHDISRLVLEQGVYMCSFLSPSEVSAFDFLRTCLGLVVSTHEFEFQKEKVVANFKEKIIFDSVVSIKRGPIISIKTKNGTLYKAEKIIVALPPQVAQKLLGIKKIKRPAHAYMWHISGKLKEKWKTGQYELFKSGSEIIFIKKQHNGTYIMYSKNARLNLTRYFTHPKILFKKSWMPAFNIIGTQLFDLTFDNNIYLAGDYNVAGLEDSYISGIYAAHKIMHNA